MKGIDGHKTLIVLTGPTGVGKTETAIWLAEQLSAEIISADARQFYKELQIGTAAPTPSEKSRVKHHLAGHLSIHDYYNASRFEQDALQVLNEVFRKSDYSVLTGGSGLYIDAVCDGIDQLPDISPLIRTSVQQIYHQQGLEGLRAQLKQIDPEYYHQVDLANPNRIMRGIEVFLACGKTFSSLRKKQIQSRPFHIQKIILNRPRHELFHRIHLRTDQMVKEGIIEEAFRFFEYQHLNALNTVGYKELFAWLENRCSLQLAIEKIKTHTRRYAKRQLTWFKKYDDALWFLPSEKEKILACIGKP